MQSDVSLLGLYGTAPGQIQGGQTPWWLLFCWWHLGAVLRAVKVTQAGFGKGQEDSEQGCPKAGRSGGHLGNLTAKGNHSFSLKVREKEFGCPRVKGFVSEMRKCFLHFLKGGGNAFGIPKALLLLCLSLHSGVDVTLGC